MILPFCNQFGLLAKSGWGDLFFVLLFIGISVVSAITKSLAKRSKESGEDENEPSEAVKIAQKYKKMREQTAHQQQGRQQAMSEWDKKQAMKRRQVSGQQPAVPQNRWQNRPQQPQRREVIRPKVQTDQPQKPAKTPVFYDVTQKRRTAKSPVYKKQQPKRSPSPVVQRAAKAIPEKKKRQPEKPRELKTKTMPRSSLREMLKQPSHLRSAIILKEILDKPIALREDF